MVDQKPFGLIKFFKDPNKLESLRDGLFYCNTPEFYRLSGDEGVSDPHESCSHAYRKSRGDGPIKLEVDGYDVGGVFAFTLHGPNFKDHWLHCWFTISIPEDKDHLIQLASDIDRMRLEFGAEYAFIPADYLPELLNRLQSVTDHNIFHGPVDYSSVKRDWSAMCKPASYSYQREYRFLLGECPHTTTEPLIVQNKRGFRDLILRSPELKIENRTKGHVWFMLNAEGCSVSPIS